MELGETVILDGSWTSAHHRIGAAELAADADFYPLRCEAPSGLAAQRLRSRPHGTSDADATIAAAMAATAAAWPEASHVDTSGEVEQAIATALSIVRPYGAEHVWPRRSQIAPD